MTKTCVIFHSCDLDGWMSAAVAKLWYTNLVKVGKFTALDSIDFIGYNYGQPIPDLSGYDRVVMCDISFPKEEMLKLWETKGLNFIWIDHHISAIKEMENAHENITSGAYPIQGLRDVKFAACELTWKYFFPNEEMPEIVRLLGMYDTFRHKGTNEEYNVLIFQYAARAYMKNYEDCYNFLINKSVFHDTNNEPNTIEMMMLYGSSIYQYLCTEAKQAYKNGFDIIFYEPIDLSKDASLNYPMRKFICINKERFNPINFGIDYHSDGYDGVACFYFNGKNWSFSLYNDNGKVDCSEICKSYGGGGHRSAAGFITNDITRFIKEHLMKITII